MTKKTTEVLCKIVCSNCGKEAFVPFVADGSREYFCDECLRDFNTLKKRGKVKAIVDSKGRTLYEFICDVCGKYVRSAESPKKGRNLRCLECDEKEQQEKRKAKRRKVVIAE